MVTEAKWGKWHPKDFRPYVDVVGEAFGPNRIMIGSDWPVCLLSANYETLWSIPWLLLCDLSAEDREKVWGANAVKFYKLKI
jgi:L-fuconolactonase